MKRTLICFALIFALCVGGMAYAAVAVNDRADEVAYTETVLLGDPAMLEGVTTVETLNWNKQLFWTTEHRFGTQPETATEYTYHSIRQEDDREAILGVRIGVDVNADLDLSPDAEWLTGLDRAFRDLYDETQPGEEKERVLRVKDYLDYYPIDGDIGLPGTKDLWIWSEHDVLVEDKNGSRVFNLGELIDENGAYDLGDGNLGRVGIEQLNSIFLSRFFRIPVLEEETITLRVTKDAAGKLESYHVSRGMETDTTGYISGSESNYAWDAGVKAYGDCFTPYSRWTYTDDTAYFTFFPRTNGGTLVDTSQIPGGYGIYALPYDSTPAENELGFDTRQIYNFYPLDPEWTVLNLNVSKDGRDLLILSEQEEEGRAKLTVVEIATGETKHVFEFECEQTAYLGEMQIFDDFLYFWIDEKIVVLSWNEAGEYTLEFVADGDGVANDGVTVLENPTGYPAADWDGERLILGAALRDSHFGYTYRTIGMEVVVYDETGMIYFGTYDNSLSTRGRTGNAVSGYCTEIRWP